MRVTNIPAGDMDVPFRVDPGLPRTPITPITQPGVGWDGLADLNNHFAAASSIIMIIMNYD